MVTIIPLKGIIYRPLATLVIGLVSSPGILSTGLKYRPLGLTKSDQNYQH